MKQLFTILLLTLATVAKSQSTATCYSDTIKIPTPVAKTIAKELAVCDSLKDVHAQTVKQLIVTEQKVFLKDSVISSLKEKCVMYDTMLVNEQKKFAVQNEWVKDLRKEVKVLKVKVLYTKISMGAVIAFLGYLLIK